MLTITVPSNPVDDLVHLVDSTVLFDFDVTQAEFTRNENSIKITFPNSSSITIQDFFDYEGQILLADGVYISQKDFIDSFAPSLSTALGASAVAPSSSGTNYTDDAGDLINGLDKMGKLGTDYWDSVTEPLEPLPSSQLAFSFTSSSQDPVQNTTDKFDFVTREDFLMDSNSCSGSLPTKNALTYSIKDSGLGEFGSFSVDTNGDWTYTLNTDINHMAQDQSYLEKATLVINDGHGVVTEQELTLTIFGDNDVPVLSDQSITWDYLGSSPRWIVNQKQGDIAHSDVDDGDYVKSLAVGSIVATLNDVPIDLADYLEFNLTADGHWVLAPSTDDQARNMQLTMADNSNRLIIHIEIDGYDTHDALGTGTLHFDIFGNYARSVFSAPLSVVESATSTIKLEEVLDTNPQADLFVSTAVATHLDTSAVLDSLKTDHEPAQTPTKIFCNDTFTVHNTSELDSVAILLEQGLA